MRERFGLNETSLLIVAASTHDPEERIVIEAFQNLRRDEAGSGQTARLLIAPRHPERFAETRALLDSSGLSWSLRSDEAKEEDKHAACVLLDSIGELRAVYPLARLVFVGGSIATAGGHNVLEPAEAGACIITGANTKNFAAIVNDFLEADALVQLPPLTPEQAPGALLRVFEELLHDDARRLEMIGRARAVVDRKRGATTRTVDRLWEMMNAKCKMQNEKNLIIESLIQ